MFSKLALKECKYVHAQTKIQENFLYEAKIRNKQAALKTKKVFV